MSNEELLDEISKSTLAWLNKQGPDPMIIEYLKQVSLLAELARLRERDECAKIAEKYRAGLTQDPDETCKAIAAEIRHRGVPK